jgi:dephospho-CoA kinase
MKKIIGIAGEIASGKDMMKNHLVDKYKATPYKFSSLVRSILEIMHLPDNRENMNKLSLVLRNAFGEDIFSKVVYETVKNDDNEYIAIDGVRRPEDLEYFKKFDNFILVYIESSMEKRYERIIERKENPDDETKSLEEFKNDHKLNTELQIPGFKKLADYVIENNGTAEEFYQKIDEIVNKN